MPNNKRFTGYMKPLKTNTTPSRLLFFDTETTYPTKESKFGSFDFILGVAIYLELDKGLNTIIRRVYRFTDKQAFVSIISNLCETKTPIYVFAHNIGFDIRVLDLPNVFNELDFTSEPPIINEMTFIWQIKAHNTKLIFMDTANLGVRSVEKLGDDMGFPKLKINFDTCTQDELFIYCENDVLILEKFVVSYLTYITANELGSFKLTLASQSMAAFRTRFMNNPPYIHNNPQALTLERNSYHGGRVECYFIGQLPKQPYYYLDVNSMYPYSMLGDKLPYKFRGYTENITVKYLEIRMNLFYCICEVDLCTDEPVYPILLNNKLVFPIGDFTTTLHHEELEYALLHGHIKNVRKCAVYDRKEIFNSYIGYFYEQKTRHTIEHNSTWRTIDKLFLNSLYGKFGQLNPTRELLGTIQFNEVYRLPCINPATNEHYQEVCWYGDVYRESKSGETPLSCPAIAGAITARGRMTLYKYITKAGRDNVFYVDTDSLIVNQHGYDNLNEYLNDTLLGYLKIEDQSDKLIIMGNKDYTFGDVVKIKGVPKKAVELSKARWEYLQFEGFITWLNNGAKGSPKGYYRIKERKTEYNKGKVLPNGKVIPFVLSPPV